MASVADVEAEIGWAAAKELVLDAYGSFSGELADTARRFFDGAWIDAAARPGKRPGAFCAYTVPSHHPYLLLNWTARRRDVLTLAHELGHGLHAYLAREQGVFHQTTPLTLAETASVFGETVTFGRLLERGHRSAGAARAARVEPRGPDRNRVPADRDEPVRGRDPQRAARRGRAVGRPHRRAVGRHRSTTCSATRSRSPTATARGGRTSRTSSATPGYVYAYAYGQLLALSVYAQYEARGADFVPQYLDLLRAGGSMSPEELGKLVDVDLADPGFWDRGLDIIERRLDETTHAKPPSARRGRASRMTTASSSGAPATSARPRCGASSAIPTSSSSGVWVHSADKAGKDAGELCGLAPTGVLATNDADALLALDADCVWYTATADLRPTDAINDMARILASGKNVVSSSVVAAVWPAAPRARDARAARRRVPRPGGVSCFTSGIDPGWANDILPLLLTGTCENVEHLRVMEIVNYKHYEQPTVLFDTMGFGQALDAKPLLLIPGVLSFAWGGVVKVLAAGLGVEIDELREVHERRPAPEKIDLGFGVIEEGTTAAMRFEVQGDRRRRAAHRA